MPGSPLGRRVTLNGAVIPCLPLLRQVLGVALQVQADGGEAESANVGGGAGWQNPRTDGGYRSALVVLWPSVMATKAIVSTQQTTIVMNTPFQPQWSAIQPTPVPAMAEPNT